MRLKKVLEKTNILEKNSFFKKLEQIIEENKIEEIEEILSNNSRELKNIDNDNISKVFEIVKENFKNNIQNNLENSLSQTDILIDIITRDGNSIMTREWFYKLYEKAINELKINVENFNSIIENGSKDIDNHRLRDYKIYKAAIHTAYHNDEVNNSDFKVTSDEYSILRSVSNSLGLSNEENRLINYSILPIVKKEVDSLIKDLKDLGILFYSKKNYTCYIPDEIIRVLRELRGKNIADKYLRRLFLTQKDSTINLVARRYNIHHKLDKQQKINKLIANGINIYDLLGNAIFKDDINISERKKEINSLMESLEIKTKGTTLNDKIDTIIEYFTHLENDERVSISNDGYNLLVKDLKEHIPFVNDLLKETFELQQDNVLNHELLLDYNIKPLDILELTDKEKLKEFCLSKEIKTRGNILQNILDNYTNSENLLIENFVHIGNRDLNELKKNNLDIPSSEFGVKYEEITKKMFSDLGFNVDDILKAEINTSKDKIDILINIEGNEVIIIECKTAKSKTFDKFSSVSRQIKSYHDSATKKGYRVNKTLLVAPNFSEDFIYECELQYDLNLSLISSQVLYNIWEGFKEAKHKVFPVNLLMRDVIIDDNKILKALKVK